MRSCEVMGTPEQEANNYTCTLTTTLPALEGRHSFDAPNGNIIFSLLRDRHRAKINDRWKGLESSINTISLHNTKSEVSLP